MVEVNRVTPPISFQLTNERNLLTEQLEASEQQEGLSVHPGKEDIEKMISGVNQFLTPSHTSAKFVLHEKLNDYYVQIVDDRTQEVIKEIPPKKFLDMYAAMLDFMGLLVDKKI